MAHKIETTKLQPAWHGIPQPDIKPLTYQEFLKLEKTYEKFCKFLKEKK